MNHKTGGGATERSSFVLTARCHSLQNLKFLRDTFFRLLFPHFFVSFRFFTFVTVTLETGVYGAFDVCSRRGRLYLGLESRSFDPWNVRFTLLREEN